MAGVLPVHSLYPNMRIIDATTLLTHIIGQFEAQKRNWRAYEAMAKQPDADQW
jgi:hypothetical protein